MCLLFDLAISFLEICPEDMPTKISKHICTWLFLVALLKLQNTGNNLHTHI